MEYVERTPLPIFDHTPPLSIAYVASDDQRLLLELQAGSPGAATELFDRYGGFVQRVLARTLGVDAELADLLHEVFVQALQSIHQVRDGQRLKAWLTSVAVFTARGRIRARQRHRWLRFTDPHVMPDAVQPAPDHELQEAIRSTYRILEHLSADLRIPFALRFIDGMELTEIAGACGVSLATIKRRLAKAEKLFVKLARRNPSLRPWLEEGSRWREE